MRLFEDQYVSPTLALNVAQMLAELGAGLQSPMAAFVGALNGLFYMFAGALEALRTQKEGAGAGA